MIREFRFPGLLVLLLFGMIGSAAAAENTLFDSPVGNSRISELEEVLALLSGYPVLKGSFSQDKEVTRLKRTFHSEGDFIFTDDSGILWRVAMPFPSDTLLLADKMVQRTPDGNQTVLDGSSNQVFQSFSSAMLAVFSGNYENLADQFELYLSNEGGSYLIGMVPRDETVRTVVASIVLRVGEQLEEMVMTEAHGDRIVYNFNIRYMGDSLDAEELGLFLP